MKKIIPFINILLIAAELVCGIVCMIQFVMAICYGELGRVVFYAVLAVFAVELFFISLMRLRKDKNAQS